MGNVTSTSRDLSFSEDEIQVTLPFSVDIQQARTLLQDILQKYTREVQKQAVREFERLGEKKFLTAVETEPTVFVHIDKHQILRTLKYYTESHQWSEIKNQIVEEISRLIPGITDVDR